MNDVTEVWRMPVGSQEIDGPEARLKYQTLVLSYRVEGKEAPEEIRFEGVGAVNFTQFSACTREHLAAYDKLLVVRDSAWAQQVRSGAREDFTAARHYRIFFDEVGCYDVLADDVAVPR